VLRAAIRADEEWNTAPLAIFRLDTLVPIDDDIEANVLASMKLTIQNARWHERNDLATRRALALALWAYVDRAVTGKTPTVAGLKGQGIDATDPWTGKKMSLHVEGKRIWVGGLRPSPKDPQKPEQVADLADWRP
jgi:hypothetical protein